MLALAHLASSSALSGMELPTQESGKTHRQHSWLGQYNILLHLLGESIKLLNESVIILYTLQASAIWSISYYSSPLLLCYLYRKGMINELQLTCNIWELLSENNVNIMIYKVTMKHYMISAFTVLQILSVLQSHKLNICLIIMSVTLFSVSLQAENLICQ